MGRMAKNGKILRTEQPARQARRAGSASGADARPSPIAGGPKAGVLRVLCVDDHAVLVEGLRARFAIHGEIEIIGHLSTAERLTEEVSRLRPDVVMLDIEMPGPDAFEMCDRMMQRHPDVRVVVLSAHVRDAFISASFRAGVCAYFAKSDELDDIVRGIHEVARSKSTTFLLGPKVRERCRPAHAAGSGDNGHVGLDARVMRTGTPMTLLDSLTSRENEILRLIGKGLSRTQIAAQLCRSAKTIDAHQGRMMKKLGITARADLMRFAIREGLAQA